MRAKTNFVGLSTRGCWQTHTRALSEDTAHIMAQLLFQPVFPGEDWQTPSHATIDAIAAFTTRNTGQ